MNDQLHTDLLPLPNTRIVSFSLVGEHKEKYSLGFFEQILKSEPILPSNTNTLTEISVAFDWKYKGSPNLTRNLRKVRIELLSHKDGRTKKLAQKIYEAAPHQQYESKKDIIDSQHDLVQKFNQGDIGTCTFAFGVTGSDGWEGLYVRNVKIDLILSSSSSSSSSSPKKSPTHSSKRSIGPGSNTNDNDGIPTLSIEYQTVPDTLLGLISALRGCELASVEKRQLPEAEKAVAIFAKRLALGEISDEIANKMVSITSFCLAYDWSSATAMQTSLVTNEWKEHEDWLKGIKALVQLATEMYSRKPTHYCAPSAHIGAMQNIDKLKSQPNSANNGNDNSNGNGNENENENDKNAGTSNNITDRPVRDRQDDGDKSWEVRIYNDGMNNQDYVARSLVQITGISEEFAYQTMYQAHQNNGACVGRFSFEIAKAYHEGLKVQGIVSNIVPVEDVVSGTTNGLDRTTTSTGDDNDNDNGNNNGTSITVDPVPSMPSVKKPEQQQPPKEQSQKIAPNATINDKNIGDNSSNTNGTASLSTKTKRKKKKGQKLDRESALCLEQQVQMEMTKNELAYQFLACRQFWLFTIPQALLTMSSSVLAFLATSMLFDEPETTQIITLVVGALSAVVVFLQTMSGICVYGSRAAMHNATAISFRNLRDELNMIKFESAFEERRRSRMKLANDNHDDDDSDDDNDGDTGIATNNNFNTFSDLRIRFKQCQMGLQSVVPMPISDAFHSVDSNLMTRITEKNVKQAIELYGALFTGSTHDIMYFKAFDFLVGEFLASKGFPFFLPDPNVIVAKTMKKLWIHMHGINNFEKKDKKQGRKKKDRDGINDIGV